MENTQTAKAVRMAWSVLHDIPAVTAATAVLLFLLAALLPLSVLVVLVIAHVVMTMVTVLPQTRSQAARAVLFCDHVSELSLLLVALAVSVVFDPTGEWQQSLSARLMAGVSLVSFVGVVLPKSQVLRMTLLQGRSPLSLRSAISLIAVSVTAVVMSPLLLGTSFAVQGARIVSFLTLWKL